MNRIVVRVIAGTQIALVAAALFTLYDVKLSSGRFGDGEPLELTWIGVLVPAVASLAIGLSALLALRGRTPRSRGESLFPLVPIAAVVAWWLALTMADSFDWVHGPGRSVYAWFFVRSGRLPPNEIMGSSWPLFVVVALLSFAALLGLGPLVLNRR